MPGILHVLAYLFLTTNLWGRCHAHFPKEEDEAWKNLISCPRLHSILNTQARIWTMPFYTELSALMYAWFFFLWQIQFLIIRFILIYHIIPTSLLAIPGTAYSHLRALALNWSLILASFLQIVACFLPLLHYSSAQISHFQPSSLTTLSKTPLHFPFYLDYFFIALLIWYFIVNFFGYCLPALLKCKFHKKGTLFCLWLCTWYLQQNLAQSWSTSIGWRRTKMNDHWDLP